MRAEVASIKALLEPLGYPVFFVDATGAKSYPYVLLWSSAGTPGDETPLDDVQSDFDDLLGVTSVAGNPDSAVLVALRVRGALTPDGLPRDLDVTGRRATLRFERSELVTVDRDVTINGAHPGIAVDRYRLVSTPA